MQNVLNRKKNQFSDFFSRVMVIFVLKSPQFSMNFYDNSKNKYILSCVKYISLVGKRPRWAYSTVRPQGRIYFLIYRRHVGNPCNVFPTASSSLIVLQWTSKALIEIILWASLVLKWTSKAFIPLPCS